MSTLKRGVLHFRKSDQDNWIRASDLICWRALDGKPCLSATDRQHASRIQAVIIPILFSNHPSDVEAIMAHCHLAYAACMDSGVSVALDQDLRLTPGFKFNVWENRGVATRIEIGSKEAASGSACIIVHPHYAAMPQVQLTMAELLSAEAGSSSELASPPRTQTAPSRRLQTPLEAIGSSCMRILQAMTRQSDMDLRDHPEPPLIGPPCSKIHVFKLRKLEDADTMTCVEHIKFLVGLGRRCHCGIGHVCLAALKAEIEALYSEQHLGQSILSWGRRKRPSPNGEGTGALGGAISPCGSSDDEGEGGHEPCTVFVGNLPLCMSASQVRLELESAFAPFARSGAVRGDLGASTDTHICGALEQLVVRFCFDYPSSYSACFTDALIIMLMTSPLLPYQSQSHARGRVAHTDGPKCGCHPYLKLRPLYMPSTVSWTLALEALITPPHRPSWCPCPWGEGTPSSQRCPILYAGVCESTPWRPSPSQISLRRTK